MLITVITLQMSVSKKLSNLVVVGLSHLQPLSFHRSFIPDSPVPKRKVNHTFMQKEEMFRFMKYKLRLWGGKKQQHLLFKWGMASN